MSLETSAEPQEKLDSLESNPDKLTTSKFAVKGGKVNVKETDEELLVENVPVQALGKDRDGDKITEEGQKEIVEQLKSGDVPAFPNHGIGDHDAIYDFRDIMGQWVDGRHEDGMTFGTLRLRKENEAAEHLKDLLQQDMPVGFSVGFIPKDFDQNESQDMNGEAITGLDLMEISPVGIPSKPEAVNELDDEPVAMAKSIMKENKGASTPEEFTKQFTKRLKNAMSQKNEESEKDEAEVQNQEGKSEEQEKDQTIKQLSEEDVNTITDTLQEHMSAAMEEIEEQLSSDSDDEEEETDEADEDEGEEEEEDSVEQDNQETENEGDEKDGSDHNEDSEEEKSGSAESDEKDNDPESEEKESGLSEEEKTLDESDEKNTIDTIDQEKDQSGNEENQEEKSGEINDPFVITEDSKA